MSFVDPHELKTALMTVDFFDVDRRGMCSSASRAGLIQIGMCRGAHLVAARWS
jgi:hypothetical protein